MQYADAQPNAHAGEFSLAEELVLLAVDPERGKLATERTYLRWGLAAATLVELEAAGRVAEDDRGRIAIAGTFTGVPHLDDALATLQQQRRGRVRTRRWLELYAHRAEELAVAALTARDALHVETRRAMGLFPVQHYQVFATQRRDHWLATFQSCAEQVPGDHRSRALCALFKATKLARSLGVPRAVRKEMRPLMEEFGPIEALRRRVAAAQSSGGRAGGGAGDGGGSGGDGGGGGGGGGGC